MNRLFLIDAYAMIYKAYYAFIQNPMMNSKGESTSAAFGFVTMLLEILKKESPSHIAVVFDSSVPTFRTELSPEYKAQRPPTPEGIKTMLPYIKQILQFWGIHQVMKDGYEADDTIGTLAQMAANQGFEVYMVTPDKDYNQLLGNGVMLYHPNKGKGYEIITAQDFCNNTGLDNPQQFIDILALWGDSADNVKGVTGIGEKTAYKLILQYKSLENIYENIENLKGKQKENFIKDRDVAVLAKKLVTICTNVPIDFVADEFVPKPIDEENLRKIFAHLEFKTLIDRVLGKKSLQPFGEGTLFANLENVATEKSKPLYDTIETINHEYILLSSDDDVKCLVDKLLTLNEFCCDTETTGLTIQDNKLVGMSFCYESHKAYFIHFQQDDNARTERLLRMLKPLFENENIRKIGQNIKFDINVLRQYDIKVCGELYDTMVAHYLLWPEQRHNMDYLSEAYLNYTPVHIEQLIGEKGNQKSMSEVDVNQLVEYAAEDADVTWQLYLVLKNEVEKAGMSALAHNIEMPFIYVLADMEWEGVKIDSEFLSEYSKELNSKIEKLESKIYEYNEGEAFNIASSKQLGDVLFEKLKIDDKPKTTKTGKYSTSEEELLNYQDKHPIVNMILEYRGLKKLVNTYTEALPQLINSKTGKIHTSFNQTVTATGRLSSTNPNIQNIPIRTPEGKKVRAAFVPSCSDNSILAADYSQVELRVMAHFANDENMIAAFNMDEDFHRETAAKIFHIAPENVTKDQRALAKSANFGINYGISSFGLAKDTGLSLTEAKELITNYFTTFSGVKKFIDNTIEQCRKDGYVSTMFGHRRYLKDINSANYNVRTAAERLAVNTPIQGTAAEIIKIAMLNIFSEFQAKNLKSKLLIQVHDELVFDVVPDEKSIVKQIVEQQMENAVELKVKLKVEANYAENWLLAH